MAEKVKELKQRLQNQVVPALIDHIKRNIPRATASGIAFILQLLLVFSTIKSANWGHRFAPTKLYIFLKFCILVTFLELIRWGDILYTLYMEKSSHLFAGVSAEMPSAEMPSASSVPEE